MARSWKYHQVALAATLLLACGAPASAGQAGNFALVNATGSDFSGVAVRRTGSTGWRPIDGRPANGATSDVAFSDPDCAFDLRATLAGGGEAVWGGVNLCEVKRVTLRRDASGAPFVDYD